MFTLSHRPAVANQLAFSQVRVIMIRDMLFKQLPDDITAYHQSSLKHQANGKMSARKLAAPTVIHNYFITRQDGTTAAERIFWQPPDDLFEWFLEHTGYPPLPAQNWPNNRSITSLPNAGCPKR